MAMTTIPVTTLFSPSGLQSITSSTFVLDTTDDWIAWVFPWPGGDLTKFAFFCTAVSGSPVVTGQLFNVDKSDGTASPVNTGSAIGSAIDSGTLAANTVTTISGIGQSSLAAGEYALRLIFKSGTSATIATRRSQSLTGGSQFPMVVTVTNGAAQVRLSAGSHNIAIGGSTFVPVIGCSGPSILTSTSYNSGSSPDEYGLWFTNPWPADVRLCGVNVMNFTTTRPNLRAALYSGSLGSPSQDYTQTYDRDIAALGTGNPNVMQFDTKQTIPSGATRGIGIRATTGENTAAIIGDYQTGNEQMMDVWWGQNATLFTRVGNAGALTQTTYQFPFIQLLIDGIDPGSGSVTGIGVLTGGGMAR